MKVIVYGIVNCDSVRKARKWLKDHGVEYHFHDLRTDGVTASQLQKWLKAVGIEQLLNRRGQAWRKLGDQERAQADSDEVVGLLLKNPLLIKRPLIEAGRDCLVGFAPETYSKRFT